MSTQSEEEIKTASPDVETPQEQSTTDRLSDAFQQGIKVVIGSNRKPPRRFKTLLHGTWLGHPLHPAITDVPVAAWLLAGLFDVLWLAAPSQNLWAARGAEWLVIVGIAGAVAAAITGMADWSDTYGAERTVGLYHGALNTLALLLFIISAVLRFTVDSGMSIPAAILGFVGIAMMLVAAYLGGDMVFGKGTGVNHTAWEAAPDDYESVLPVDQLSDRTLRRVTVADVPVALLKAGESYYAIAATCTHAGGPLDEGELQGEVVQCPWHGSRFRMSDGKPITGPATFAQPRYDVRVRDGMIQLRRR
jgi:nitrite reductase/ring-hydroxylating ferredoxin subunit/uncharacterized membrane protein